MHVRVVVVEDDCIDEGGMVMLILNRSSFAV